jgi:hypothetical protein
VDGCATHTHFARSNWKLESPLSTSIHLQEHVNDGERDTLATAIASAKGVAAYQLISCLAATHGIGVYDLSDNGDVWFPTADGRLEVVLRAAG